MKLASYISGILLLFCLSAQAAHPKPTPQNGANFKFQTMFIYNFTRYMEWSQVSNREFVIGILGKSPIQDELMKMAQTRKVGGKRIIIRNFATPAEVKACQILYVAENYNTKLPTIGKVASNQNMLVVANGKGLATNGAHISFFELGNNVRFELNKKTTQQAGIKVSSMLDKLAVLVN